jgi:hypothetical protein
MHVPEGGHSPSFIHSLTHKLFCGWRICFFFIFILKWLKLGMCSVLLHSSQCRSVQWRSNLEWTQIKTNKFHLWCLFTTRVNHTQKERLIMKHYFQEKDYIYFVLWCVDVQITTTTHICFWCL